MVPLFSNKAKNQIPSFKKAQHCWKYVYISQLYQHEIANEKEAWWACVPWRFSEGNCPDVQLLYLIYGANGKGVVICQGQAM